MTSEPGRRWQAPGLHACRWASWEDGEYFLFNPASGKTHLLNEHGKVLLESLAEAPRDSRELTALFSDPDDDAFANDLSRVEDQLRQMQLIGLVEAAG